MAKRTKIKTKIADIVTYWQKILDENSINVDWQEANTHCWRCGCESDLQRCHIVPDSLGGTDEPSNFVLLCKRCHKEGPNVDDKDIMWDWIRAYKVDFYQSFWGFIGAREYKFIYGKSIYKEIEDILVRANIPFESTKAKTIIKEFKEIDFNHVSTHFGEEGLSASSLAGVYRMNLKRIAKGLKVDLSCVNDNKKPWYSEV